MLISLLAIEGKAGAFILLNTWHSPFADIFFTYYTDVGDGLFSVALVVMLFLLLKDKRLSVAMLSAFLLAGLLAQILKRIANEARPKLYFKAGQYNHFIDGVTLSNTASFPSGHTATAFAAATVLAMITKNKTVQVLVFLAAVMVGFSRIYLAQHFILDVLVGAVTGCGAGIFCMYMALKIKPKNG